MELIMIFVLFEIASGGCLTASVAGAAGGATAGAARGAAAGTAPRRKSLQQRLRGSRKGRALVAAGGAAGLVGAGIAGAARGAAGGAAAGFVAAHRVRRERVPSPAAIAVRKVREKRRGTATAPGQDTATAPRDGTGGTATPEATAPGDGTATAPGPEDDDTATDPRDGTATAPGRGTEHCERCGERITVYDVDGTPSCVQCSISSGQYVGLHPGECPACSGPTVVQDGKVRCPSCGTPVDCVSRLRGAHHASTDCGCDGCTAAVAASTPAQVAGTTDSITAPGDTEGGTNKGGTTVNNTTSAQITAEDAGITPYLATWDQAADTDLEAIIASVSGTAAALAAAVEANHAHDTGGGADAIGALQHAVAALTNAQEQLSAHAAELHSQWDSATEALSSVTASSAQEFLGQR